MENTVGNNGIVSGAEEETLAGGGKSFKELHAERNKQAQRRFRKRQKVCARDSLLIIAR